MYFTVLIDLPTSIKGYIVSNPDDTYTIVLNSRLTWEKNLSSYEHELKHLSRNDYEKENVQIIESEAH